MPKQESRKSCGKNWYVKQVGDKGYFCDPEKKKQVLVFKHENGKDYARDRTTGKWEEVVKNKEINWRPEFSFNNETGKWEEVIIDEKGKRYVRSKKTEKRKKPLPKKSTKPLTTERS